MQDQGVDHLWLDMRPVGEDRLQRQFPTILGRCLELGLQPTKNPIPVAPAAHYWMGGVHTDLQAATSLPGLYAVGEVACTGVHGANRLASNSLMECLVFARQLASLPVSPESVDRRQLTIRDLSGPLSPRLSSHGLQRSIEELRSLCWTVTGVERRGSPLLKGLRQVRRQRQACEDDPLWQGVRQQPKDVCFQVPVAQVSGFVMLHELWQRLALAELLMEAALFREESRGGHFRTDIPAVQPYWQRHSRQQWGQLIQTEPVIRTNT
jgi:L-aspartate oxidase